jgi:hypothetical protein
MLRWLVCQSRVIEVVHFSGNSITYKRAFAL